MARDTDVHGAALGEALLDYFEDTIDHGGAATGAHPEARAALVDYLEARFVLGAPSQGEFEHDDAWWDALQTLARSFGGDERAAFVARVGLRATHSEAYRWIAPIARAAFDDGALDAWVGDALRASGDDPVVLENASALMYFAQ